MKAFYKNIAVKLLLLAILLIVHSTIFSQTTIQGKFGFIGIHPFESPNKHLYDNTIDANKNFTVEPMLMVPIETFIRGDHFSWRIAPGFLTDAVGNPAMFIHLGLKHRIIQIYRNSVTLAVGGNLYGRERWDIFSDAHPYSGWSANGDWEFKLGIMAEIEYAFYINDNNDITLSGIYGHQEDAFTFTIGYRYWFSNIIKNPPRCSTCPFEHTQRPKERRIFR